jgi:hypothetical protein
MMPPTHHEDGTRRTKGLPADPSRHWELQEGPSSLPEHQQQAELASDKGEEDDWEKEGAREWEVEVLAT